MEKLKLSDFLEYRFVSQPVMAPDKTKCAFVLTQIDKENNGYKTYVNIYCCKSGEVKRLTHEGCENAPVWLDDETILYKSDDRQNNEKDRTTVCAVNVYSGELRVLFDIPMKVSKLFVRDKDNFVLLCSYKNHDMPFEGESQHELETRADCFVADELPFRRDGEGIVNGVRKRIYLYNNAKGELVPITHELQEVEHICVCGDKVLYGAKYFSKDEPYWYPCGIYEYDCEDKTTTQHLADDLYRIRFCGYMDEKIVFMGSDRKRYGNQENPWFFYVNKGEVTLLAKNEFSAMNSVICDSKYGGGSTTMVYNDALYYISTVGGSAVLKVVNKDGSIQTLTPETGTVESFDVAGDKVIFVGLQNYKLPELYCVENGKITQLTEYNEWIYKEKIIMKPEEFTFQSGGFDLTCYVIKPANFDEKKIYPAILDIHGGHKCAYGPVYMHEMQLWANEGYFVIYCNPRGSDGGSNDFAEIIGKYGDIDYADLMQFVDICLEKYPMIDKDRLGVTGGSYGGYMTNWIIGHTDRFKCAASQRSISSYITMFTNSDTGHTFPMYDFNSNPWGDTEKYQDMSPLKYADKVKTPTLFIHSENDYRCPLNEGIQMFSSLKFHGVESRICVFRGEGHELSRAGKPYNRIRRLQEITNWMNRFLNPTT